VKTILVVDDEPQIAGIVSDYLRLAGFDVIVTGDGVRALEAARGRRPDLVVLDLGLPGLDGLEVARTLRKESEVPIIMLTARVEEDDRLDGLEIGADDYVTKPFSPRELVARVRAVLRRSEGRHVDGDLLRVSDLVIDVARMSVRRGDGPMTSRRPNSSSSPPWPATPAGCSPAPNCSTPRAAPMPRRTNAPSTAM
jgi:two-component system, OmpR family, alkaline phosphatase synthesis response regulator PhoP